MGRVTFGYLQRNDACESAGLGNLRFLAAALLVQIASAQVREDPKGYYGSLIGFTDTSVSIKDKVAAFSRSR